MLIHHSTLSIEKNVLLNFQFTQFVNCILSKIVIILIFNINNISNILLGNVYANIPNVYMYIYKIAHYA